MHDYTPEPPTELAQYTTIAGLVATYQQAKSDIEQAFDLLEKAGRDLDTAFGISAGSGEFSFTGPHKADRDQALDYLHRKAWRMVYERLDIRRLLNQKRSDQLDADLDRGELPEFTDAVIFSILRGLLEYGQEYAQEAILEAYRILRAGASAHDRYKTNQKYARYSLGKKVIMDGWVRDSYGWTAFRVNRAHTNNVRIVDRAFHLLDGKPFNSNSYNSPLIDAINTSTGTGETEYFQFKCWRNGNVHLTFTRPDLVAQLNKIAGGNNRLAE